MHIDIGGTQSFCFEKNKMLPSVQCHLFYRVLGGHYMVERIIKNLSITIANMGTLYNHMKSSPIKTH